MSAMADSKSGKLLRRFRVDVIDPMLAEGILKTVQIGSAKRLALATWQEPEIDYVAIALSRCKKVGKCLEWQGYCTKSGPEYRFSGVKEKVVLRTFFYHMHVPESRRLTRRHYLKMICENHECLNHEHIKRVTRASVRKGVKKPISHRLKMQQVARNRPNAMTIEQVEFIRSSDETDAQLAKRFGRAKSTINQIRLGRSWKNLSPTPFAALRGL